MRGEEAVARVAHARDDVATLVEAYLDAGREDGHVRVLRVQTRDALGAREDAGHGDRARREAARLELLDHCDRRAGRGQHRVEQDHARARRNRVGVERAQVVEVVPEGLLLRVVRLLEALEPRHPDEAVGEVRLEAAKHPEPGPQDGHEDDGARVVEAALDEPVAREVSAQHVDRGADRRRPRVAIPQAVEGLNRAPVLWRQDGNLLAHGFLPMWILGEDSGRMTVRQVCYHSRV